MRGADRKIFRYRARLWLDGEQVMDHVVKTKTALDLQRHTETSAAFAKAMGSQFSKPYFLELEFLDERDPAKRLLRFSNDPAHPLEPPTPK